MKNILKKSKLILLAGLLVSCEGFLDPKPNQSLVVPNTLTDVQNLLDNTTVFNNQGTLPLLSTNEFWATDEAYNGFATVVEQGTYRWADDPYQGSFTSDWSDPYSQVFYANVALETLAKIEEESGVSPQLNELKGAALFHRSYAYFNLLQQFSPPYSRDGDNEGSLGIVLRESADISTRPVRASLLESYSQIQTDLTMAAELLPQQASPKNRATKSAALGVLARFYLITFQYEQAIQAAEAALNLYQNRLDFNTLNFASSRPFARFNNEMIFYSVLSSVSFHRSAQVYADSTIVKLFEEGDLRLPAYFSKSSSGYYNFNKHLTGLPFLFGGISVGEMQLIAAEGYARQGNVQAASALLNELLSLRYQTGTWVDLEITDEDELLGRILEERKKELFGRGIRWTDLRRLNQYPTYQKSLIREINGEQFTLEPNSNRYVFPIPDDEIQRSGISQNPR
ncbi:RagB/SusD family nutrient uptake outer membrane protein [Algoriphagus aquimarinus]|uniref:RagB/SusD family nutrient uptake outer membrane protein n=1 Tax=Algoriphagus aquimarinus TaxID=237018 RepID=A0A5C7AGF7_9BACT|nr:RagB/SusD family nutrient uptake outer membrane protein [Algoriphagus aquimarinus]TXE03068.1 RagB/SusD family nutrient uptake outer membrane protein [Algoriphagus aquimarinus]